MPELPEVELYARYFARHALRQRVTGVRVLEERVLGVRKEALSRALRGRAFTRVHRHGKHLFASSGPSWLHLHFGMTGDLTYYQDEQPRFARVVFDFENGAHLAFEDMRLFGIVDLTGDPAGYIAEHHLGPDPLDAGFRLADFRRIVSRRRGAAKSFLMSQDVIAGVGNLYADETLFQTSIAPRRPVDRLSPDEVKSVYMTMRMILKSVIDRKSRGLDYPPRYLMLHREEGERCPRCGGTIRRGKVFGRTTYWCARHQT